MVAAMQPGDELQGWGAPRTSAVFHELVDQLRAMEGRLTGAEPPLDEQGVLEGYKWIFSILSVGLDVFLWGDTGRPRFVDIVGPYRKWGGDNADAYYQFAPVDPSRNYRVRGTVGDAVYLSLTVYGGPDDGRYSERIVGTVNDRMLDIADDGTFEFWMGPDPQDGPGILLEPDAVAAITRDYLVDPVGGRRVEWHIEAVEPPKEFRLTDEELARRFGAALTWVKEQSQMVPIGLGEANHVDDPYPVPTKTFGWAAGDAAYAMGSYDIAEDEALVIEGRSPESAFWNLCLWNRFLHTYNYDYEQVTINGGQVTYEPDGSWRIVVAHTDPGVPNWLSTQGHPSGRLWFRWFHPEATPDRPTTKVVPLSELS